MDVPPQTLVPLPMLQLPPPLTGPALTTPTSTPTAYASIMPQPPLASPTSSSYPTPSTSTSSGKSDRWRQNSLSSAGPVHLAGERESHRRLSHSAIEKRRRERINDKIDQLKHLIPACCPSNDALQSASMHQPLHKLSVLQAAIDYIHQLHAKLIHLEPDLVPPFDEADPPSELSRIIAHVRRQQNEQTPTNQDGKPSSPHFEQAA
ncbi:HLH-domain-containing protein [Hesseltinella vesiculosa]|uniref:HLH-domain-containing protein n=1 Tax=Hesseltinella vesiculosa TaxID=101127 RepID=A0A1X2GP52_9FUNG|nr:HLH-domain-containing protein [Hesseltinella vesiculosa]